MEHPDGETLVDRLTRGPMPVDEALRVGIAIAGALDRSHREGVVHGDLKPANILLTETGPKLLGFRVAPLPVPVVPASPPVERVAPASLPVPVAPASPPVEQPVTPITMAGTILGTLQYMAPEQLDGIEADARTDIFAFGVILHEMVTGRRAFEGKSQVLLISAIATSEPPPLSRVQPAVPPALDHVVKTCLAKDPDDRWQTARDLVAELQWIADGGGAAATDHAHAAGAMPVASGHRARSRVTRVVLAGAALVIALLAVPAALYVRGGPEPERLELRMATQPLNYSGNPSRNGFFSVSPDGRQMVILGGAGNPGENALHVGTFDFLTPRRLAGTESAAQPFWSPDSRAIAFVADGKLRRIEAAGGPPQAICDVPDFKGGTWNSDGTIVFGSASGLFSVPAEGGKPVAITTIGSSEAGHFWPRFLPDGRHYLYLSWSPQAADRAIVAGSLDSKDKTRVMPSDAGVVYTAPGYLLFLRERSIYAQPFDARSLTLAGVPTRVADHISSNLATGRGAFDVSSDGVLAFYRDTTETVAAIIVERAWQLAWVNRVGQNPETAGKPGVYRGVEVSPDGLRIAVHRHDPKGGDVWVIEPRGTDTRITFEASHDNSNPVWSRDGTRLTYASLRNGKWGLYQSASDGSGNEEMLLESELPKVPLQWSPDGQYLLYWVRDPKTDDDLWVWPAEDKKPRPVVATNASERHGQISPDGKWIAYSSTLTGRREIFVQPFPAGTGRWQVSPDGNAGGGWPRWNPKDNELFYCSLSRVLFSVSWTAHGTAFAPEPPKEVVRINVIDSPHDGGDYHAFAISRDAQRFLIFQRVTNTTTTETPTGDVDPAAGLTVLMHWMPK